jgi:hypothetical protein
LSASPAPEVHPDCILSQALIFSWQWPWGSLSCNVAWFGKNLPILEGGGTTAYVLRAGTLKTEAAVSTEKSIKCTKMRAVASQKTLMSITTSTTPVVGRHVAERPNNCVILVRAMHKLLKNRTREGKIHIIYSFVMLLTFPQVFKSKNNYTHHLLHCLVNLHLARIHLWMTYNPEYKEPFP